MSVLATRISVLAILDSEDQIVDGDEDELDGHAHKAHDGKSDKRGKSNLLKLYK